MQIDYKDLMYRTAAVCEEMLAEALGRSVTVFPYSSVGEGEFAFLELKQRLAADTTYGERMYQQRRVIQFVYIVGNFDAGVDDEKTLDIYTVIPAVEQTFQWADCLLTSSEYPNEPGYLDNPGVELDTDDGVSLLRHSRTGDPKRGIRFTLIANLTSIKEY